MAYSTCHMAYTEALSGNISKHIISIINAAQALGSLQPRAACWRVLGEPSRLDGGGGIPIEGLDFSRIPALVGTLSTFTSSHSTKRVLTPSAVSKTRRLRHL